MMQGAAVSVTKSRGRSTKKVGLKNVKPYLAAEHCNMVALKLPGSEESGIQTFRTGLTHFLPGGGMGAALAVERL